MKGERGWGEHLPDVGSCSLKVPAEFESVTNSASMGLPHFSFSDSMDGCTAGRPSGLWATAAGAEKPTTRGLGTSVAGDSVAGGRGVSLQFPKVVKSQTLGMLLSAEH